MIFSIKNYLYQFPHTKQPQRWNLRKSGIQNKVSNLGGKKS